MKFHVERKFWERWGAVSLVMRDTALGCVPKSSLAQAPDLCLQADTTQQRKSRAGVYLPQTYTQAYDFLFFFFSFQLQGFLKPDVVCLFYNSLFLFNPSTFPISL